MMQLDANKTTMNMVDPHAASIEACASAMRAAGIGAHPTGGHADFLDRMAASMRADAAMGKIPHIYDDTGRLHAGNSSKGYPMDGSLITHVYASDGQTPLNISAMKASAHFRGAAHLLRRAGFGEIDKILSAADVEATLKDKLLSAAERIQIKIALSRSGLMVSSGSNNS